MSSSGSGSASGEPPASGEDKGKDEDLFIGTYTVTEALQPFSRLTEAELLKLREPSEEVVLDKKQAKLARKKKKQEDLDEKIDPLRDMTKKRTIMDVMKLTGDAAPHDEAMRFKRGAGAWHSWTYTEYFNQIKIAARALLRLGVIPGSSVLIIGANSPEWAVTYFASIYSGGLAVGVYPSTDGETVQQMAVACKARVVVVESARILLRIAPYINNMPDVFGVVVWANKTDGKLRARVNKSLITWERFMQLGFVEKRKLDKIIAARHQKITYRTCASICFTPGTTGKPKGALLSHDNLTWTGGIVQAQLGTTSEDRLVSHLPLAHIGVQIMDLVGPMLVRYPVWFAPADATLGSLSDVLREVKPTLFFAVPRMWGALMSNLMQVDRSNTPMKQTVHGWASGMGTKGNYGKQLNKSRPTCWCAAQRVLFTHVREKLGLQHCRIQATGFDCIGLDALDYFLGINVPVYEFYGMVETTGVQSLSLPLARWWRPGTAGKILPMTEVRLSAPAVKMAHGGSSSSSSASGSDEGLKGWDGEEKELQFKGRNVFMGYLNDEALTKRSFTEDGFFKTGDYGTLLYDTGKYSPKPTKEKKKDKKKGKKPRSGGSASGSAEEEAGAGAAAAAGAPAQSGGGMRPLVTVVGRRQDLCRTPSGHKTVLSYIENKIKQSLLAVSQVVVIGHNKPYLTALVSLRCSTKFRQSEPTDHLSDLALHVFSQLGILNFADEEEAMAESAHLRAQTGEFGDIDDSKATKTRSFSFSRSRSREHSGSESDGSSGDAQLPSESNEASLAHVSKAILDPRVIEYVQVGIDAFNNGIAAGAHEQWVTHEHKILAWRFLPVDLSIFKEELSPMMRLRRTVIEEHCADLIGAMYETPSGAKSGKKSGSGSGSSS